MNAPRLRTEIDLNYFEHFVKPGFHIVAIVVIQIADFPPTQDFSVPEVSSFLYIIYRRHVSREPNGLNVVFKYKLDH